MNTNKHTLKWFINRINCRVYRLTDNCPCEHCQKVLKEGLVISDKNHAEYIYTCQLEMDLQYSDKL